MERRRELEQFFNEQAPIARTFGMSLAYDEQDRAVVSLPYNPGLNHAQNGIHGGVYMTLLDTAAWFASALIHDHSCWIATGELTVHFLKPSRATALTCVGSVLKPGKRQNIAEGRLYDAAGALVGHAVGTFLVLPTVPIAL